MQQPRIGGFIPDILLLDSSGAKIIVEVQKNALDRNHLYKCLEYRDNLAEFHNEIQPRVILVCEEFPERYSNIAKTHNVSVIKIDREEFVGKACFHCPASLKRHLKIEKAGEKQKLEHASPQKLKFYRWSKYQTLARVYADVMEELGRCNYKSKAENGKYSEIIYDAHSIIDGTWRINKIIDPTEWRIEGLIGKPDRYAPRTIEKYTRIRKPKAIIYMFITSKGNLSVRWHPTETKFNGEQYFDWAMLPSTEPYAYQRPENEILFVRDINFITPDPTYESYQDNDDRAALHSMLLALIWAMIKHIKMTLEPIVEIEFQDEFEIITSKNPKNNDTEDEIITGWRIIDKATKEREEAFERIEKFSKTNRVGLEEIFKKVQNIPQIPFKGEIDSWVAKQLRNDGHKITVVPIRLLFADLTLTNNHHFLEIFDEARRHKAQSSQAQLPPAT